MKTAPLETMPSSSARLYALAPDYRPELKPEHVLCDQIRPVEERIALAQAESIRVLNNLRPLGEVGDTRSQIEFAKEAKLLQWLCQPAAAEWVEEHYPLRQDILSKYRFRKLDDGFIQFTLPKGTSYLELFEEANRYCDEHGHTRSAISKESLRRFGTRTEALRKECFEKQQEITGVVTGSLGLFRSEQEEHLKKHGLVWATQEAAAAAAILYYCARGASLWFGGWVRTETCNVGLRFSLDGVTDEEFGDTNCSSDCGAAGARNLET